MTKSTETEPAPVGALPRGSDRRRARKHYLLAVLFALALGSSSAPVQAGTVLRATHAPTWDQVTSPGAGPFRGIAAVSRKVAWVGGDNGELWRTTDGGATWQDVAPPDSAGLGFRRIIPLGHGHVVLLSRGAIDDPDGEEPSLGARIFVSGDNGRTWRLSFLNQDPDAFYGCIDMFADGRHGLALSDPVDGRFRILATADWGRSWRVRPTTGMPPAVDGEFSFATGRCIETSGDQQAWFGSGGAEARIFHTSSGGSTWTVTGSTLAPDADNGGGVFGLNVTGSNKVLAVGGTFADFDLGTNASAFTVDGQTWQAGGETGGLRFSVAWLPGRPGTAVSGGFNGTDITRDGGRTWTEFSSLPYEAVDCAADGTCWGTGEDGTVARLSLH